MSELSNFNMNFAEGSWFKLIAQFTVKNLYADNGSSLTVWHTKTGVSHFSCLFSKDGAKQSLFSCQFCLTFWRNFSNKNTSWSNFTADSDNTGLVKISQVFFGNIWN